MRAEWTEHAKEQKKQIANYIRKRFGTRHATEFKNEVDQSVKRIMLHPNIGIIDPLFNDCPITYRSVIINSLSKLVYYISNNKDTIYIVAFWDTRREPKQQAQQTIDS